MCDSGEKVSNTMKREFMEEALNSLEMNDKELEDYKSKLNEFFSGGVEVILFSFFLEFFSSVAKNCLNKNCLKKKGLSRLRRRTTRGWRP